MGKFARLLRGIATGTAGVATMGAAPNPGRETGPLHTPSFSESDSMRKSNSTLTQERLREVLRYDPATGVFTWLVNSNHAVRCGDAAGCKKGGGYIYIGIDGTSYRAHRLALLYVDGHWPLGDVDHKNGIRSDNRLGNLRVGSRSQNMQNERSARVTNKSSGLLGSYWHKGAGKWMAQIVTDGKQQYLGLFDSAEEAHAAYVAKKRQVHQFCTI